MRKPPRLPLEELAPYLVHTPVPATPEAAFAPEVLDWRALFGNENPVEIEVGFGKGLFLLTAGQAHPETNFLGIEIVRKYQLLTATRLVRLGLRNVRVACADARTFLRDRVLDGSVAVVHVYFPDPWWKTRHHKRRVFTDAFAAQCARILVPGGQLRVVTDVADYAVMVRETVAGHTTLAETDPLPENDPQHSMDYLTNFERKFRMEGRSIHRMRFLRTGDRVDTDHRAAP